MKKKVAVVTLGCPKNQVDSEVMLGLLGEQYEITQEAAEAEIIVVNTCTFIEEAKQESVEAILEMAQFKEKGICQTLVAAGCLAQRYGEEIMAEIPELDGILGTEGITRVVRTVEQAGYQRIIRIEPQTAEYIFDEKLPRKRLNLSHYAYVKIAEGCDNHCTYCVIPQVRGSFRSRTIESVTREVQHLVEDGVKEILLVAQDTTRYGLDIYGERRLPELIRSLARIEDLQWIRIMYCYPDSFSDAFIEIMCEEKKVCRYLDLPIQHADVRVLKDMNRRGSAQEVTNLIAKLRAAMPDITLRTTVITGFPGETEAEFNNLLEFVRRSEFDRLGVFAYSQEDNTPAGQRQDQVAQEIRESRKDKIMKLQQEIALRRQQRWVGRIIRVLVEEKLPDGRWLGRSEGEAPEIDGQIFIEAFDRRLVPGEMAEVVIKEADSYDLLGEIV